MRVAIVSLVVLGIGLLASARDAHADEGTRTVASPVAIGGAITFGLAYTPMFILGATDTALQCTIGLLFDQCELNPLVIPVAGPFIFAASPASAVSSDYRSIHEGKGLLIADGIVQAASIGVITFGLVTSGKRSESRTTSLRPAPLLHGSTKGIALAGEF